MNNSDIIKDWVAVMVAAVCRKDWVTVARAEQALSRLQNERKRLGF